MARAVFLLLSVAMVAHPVRKADETTALFAVSLRKSRRDSAGKLLSIIGCLVEWPSELIRRWLVEQSGHAVCASSSGVGASVSRCKIICVGGRENGNDARLL